MENQESLPLTKRPQQTKPSLRRQWLQLGFFLLLILGIRSSVASPYHVPTASMEPSVMVGDRIYVNKLAYDLKLPGFDKSVWHLGEPERGDVVLFWPPTGEKIPYLKRIVGLPGDRIELRHGRVVLNGQPLLLEITNPRVLDGASDHPENRRAWTEYLGEDSHLMAWDFKDPGLRDFEEITVPQEHYFMLGDNRDNSSDSRYFGFVPRSSLIGRAFVVYASVRWDDQGFLVQWERTLQSIR